MGKVDDYTAGRSQGLILAREIVKKDGIEGLEKEIQFRNITGRRWSRLSGQREDSELIM